MFRLALLLVVRLVTTVGAADPPQSPAAKKAKSEFEGALKKLEDEYQKKVSELRLAYVKQLEAARGEALTKKDLNEAQRLLAEQKEMTEQPVSSVQLQILGAWLGWYETWKEVTPIVKKLVRGSELRLAQAIQANTGNPDPAFGQRKSLVVVYRYRGVLRVAIAGDDKPLVIPGAR
jgi:hypothetical protein